MNGYNSFDNTEQEGLYRQLFELFDNDELEEAIEGLKEAIIKYPGKAQFYNLLQGCYLYSEQTAELNAAVDDMYRLFPDFIFSKVAYAQKLIGNSGPEKALEVFNGATDLNYLYPGQKLFNIHEAAIYYAVMCLYFTAVDDIDSADLYMNVIIKKDLAYLLNQTIVSKAMYEISKAKMDKIKDKGFL
jgi:tetratricopeptide (TPR) repeat protein